MRAVRCLVVASAGFENIHLLNEAFNRVWREANHGRRKVDFTFKSTWQDADVVERAAQDAYAMVASAKQSGLGKHSWVGEIHVLNMLELKGTATREWLGIESPDIIVVLESGKHDEWLDPYRKYCRDFGARLIQVNE